ncbi:hypothetical protein AAMO2058_001667000 [Amorphochlora amoebiformis]
MAAARRHPGSSSKRERTRDVESSSTVLFTQMSLKPAISKGLAAAGFHKPSPIQLKAIPYGRFGLDLIAQAKSGTGKTCVFAVIILESLEIKSKWPQSMVVAPTREIAVQIRDVIVTIGQYMEGLSCNFFIGGLPVDTDKKRLRSTQVVVGTPGRLVSLVRMKATVECFHHVRIVALDEADQLLAVEFESQVTQLVSSLPERKQAKGLMKSPHIVRISKDEPSLEGVTQYKKVLPSRSLNTGEKFLPHVLFSNKVRCVVDLFDNLQFHQAVLFSNHKNQAEEVVEILGDAGWPAVCIAGGQDQRSRLSAIEALRAFRVRVINLDLPKNPAVYLHRVGRTGRFGTKGVAVTIVTAGAEEERLRSLESMYSTNIHPLPQDLRQITVATLENSDWVSQQDRKILEKLQKYRENATRLRVRSLLNRLEIKKSHSPPQPTPAKSSDYKLSESHKPVKLSGSKLCESHKPVKLSGAKLRESHKPVENHCHSSVRENKGTERSPLCSANKPQQRNSTIRKKFQPRSTHQAAMASQTASRGIPEGAWAGSGLYESQASYWQPFSSYSVTPGYPLPSPLAPFAENSSQYPFSHYSCSPDNWVRGLGIGFEVGCGRQTATSVTTGSIAEALTYRENDDEIRRLWNLASADASTYRLSRRKNYI